MISYNSLATINIHWKFWDYLFLIGDFFFYFEQICLSLPHLP